MPSPIVRKALVFMSV